MYSIMTLYSGQLGCRRAASWCFIWWSRQGSRTPPPCYSKTSKVRTTMVTVDYLNIFRYLHIRIQMRFFNSVSFGYALINRHKMNGHINVCKRYTSVILPPSLMVFCFLSIPYLVMRYFWKTKHLELLHFLILGMWILQPWHHSRLPHSQSQEPTMCSLQKPYRPLHKL